MSVPNGGGSPLRCEEERGGSIVFAFVYEAGGYEIWTPISMASYWLKVSLGHQDFQKIALGLFMTGNSTQS